ncbi:MAG: restriction endonuclease subunit S [Gammaproteobacteria bacterium]|nr:restriction endonuclease subunit S [Gammaproteobacteria bacterium]MDE0269948.1 restriction endonuclease subunit S [Gammaproteobacteria bacterium]
MTSSNFELRKLKHVATINDDALGEETDPEYELQYVDISNVDSSGQIHSVATYQFSNAPSRARRRVRDGDVIVSCVRTYLQAIAPIQNPPENLIVSTGFAVVRPNPRVLDARFIRYALRESSFLADVERRSVGVSYPAINASDLREISIPVPSLQIQENIVVRVEAEIHKIDRLHALTKSAQALLEERKAAVISEAVRGQW